MPITKPFKVEPSIFKPTSLVKGVPPVLTSLRLSVSVSQIPEALEIVTIQSLPLNESAALGFSLINSWLIAASVIVA